MLQRILVPTDFSPPSLQTLRYAVAFAERFGARLHLVHVVDLPQYGILSLGVPDEVAKSATKRLTELAAQFSVSDRANSITVVVGKVADEINNVARETRADLIIIATRGYSGLKYAFFGSTAEGVIRQAACPVLILRADNSAAKAPAVQVRKILAPVDFSASSRVGMNYALEFAQEFGADVTLFHAVSLRALFLGDQYTRAVGPLIPQHSEYAMSEMANLRAVAESEGHRVGTQLAFGSAVEQVSEYAERERRPNHHLDAWAVRFAPAGPRQHSRTNPALCEWVSIGRPQPQRRCV